MTTTSPPASTWATSTALAPAFLTAAIGGLVMGAGIAGANGYWDEGYRVLGWNALSRELDRNMLVALAAALVCVWPAVWMRRRGWVGKPILLAAMLAALAPVALSVWFAEEWRLLDAKWWFTARTSWEDTPLPRALRHYKLMGMALLGVAAVVGALLILGRPRSKPVPTARVHSGNRLAQLGVILALGSWAAVHVGALLSGPVSPRTPRNVIFLTWDSTRADHLSSYGHPARTTPAVDAFADDAVLFEQAYSQNNWTRPSYASMVTSRQMYQVHEAGAIRPDVTTIAEIMKAHGYQTLSVVQNPNLDASWGFEQGYDEYHHVQIEGYPDAVNAVAIPRLRALAKSDKPLFAFIHYQEPHWPYRDAFDEGAAIAPAAAHHLMTYNQFETVPDNVDEVVAFLKKCYERDVRDTDRAMGKLLDALKAAELYDESLIIFASDHGDEFYEHQAFGHGHQNLHPELTKVPMVVRFPTSLQIPSQRVKSTVNNLDLIPTILDVVGIDQPGVMLGTSLLPLERLAANPRIATSHFASVLMMRGGRYAALVDPRGEGGVQYFDLAVDPGELHPLEASAIGDAVDAFNARAQLWYADYAEVQGSKTDDGSKIDEHHHMDAQLREQLKSLGYVK